MDQFILIFQTLAEWLIIIAESFSIFLVGIGILIGIYQSLKTILTRNPAQYRKTRNLLARFLVVALEFQLAADIIATAMNPNWEHLMKLAAIAVIRTLLNYFLSRDIGHEIDS